MFNFFKSIIEIVRKIWLIPVYLYRRFISPIKPKCCRFTPTCSEYAVEAILIHGIVVGTCLSVYRIARCNPFGSFGDDPVPEYGAFLWEKFALKITRQRK